MIAQAQMAMLAALAWYVRLVLAGALLNAIATRMLRSALLTILNDTEMALRPLLGLASASARNAAQAVIDADLGPMARLLPLMPSPALPRLSSSLRLALLNAAADAERAYRAALAAGDAELAQDILDDYAASGLTGITDQAGKDWEITAYAAMSARTAIERLHLELQSRAMIEAGIDLVKVVRESALPPCPRCLPWVGKTLSLSGRDLRYPTLAQARAAGLLHPSCRDSIVPDGPDIPEPSDYWVSRQARRYEAERAARARWADARRAARLAVVAITPKARARSRALRHALRTRQRAT